MATIVPRQGPKLDQDERVGFTRGAASDLGPKWSFWGVLAKTPQKPPFWAKIGGTRKMAKMADFPGTSSHSELFF